VLSELAEYPHFQIRKVVEQMFGTIFEILGKHFPNPVQWTTGVKTDMHVRTEPTIEKLFPTILDRMKNDDDKEVVTASWEALTEACKHFGLAAFQDETDSVYEATADFLMQKAPCQQSYEEDDPENGEHDDVLDSVTDAVGVFAQVVGDEFEPIFRFMCPHLIKFCQPRRPPADRSMAIKCFASVFGAIGPRMADYLADVLPLVFAGLKDPHVDIRHNSAFCVGSIAESKLPALAQAYGDCLNGLRGLFNIVGVSERAKAGVMAARDNAVCALCKMITANPGALPLPDAIDLMLSGCPLVEDQAEAKYVYPCIIQLFASYPDLMTPHIPTVMSVFLQVLETDHVDEQVKSGMVMLCKSFAQPGGAQVQSLPQAQTATQLDSASGVRIHL
jgi:hypothetical protein